MHIKAFQLMVRNDNLNCNVKFMIEGEEEVGSNNLEEFIKNNKEKLNADIILISDTGLSNINNPTLTVGLRGLSYMEIKVIGPNRDLHSGTYGGTIYNPANALAKIITSLIDDNGKITIPGFYDDVINIDNNRREEIEKKSNFDVESFKESLGIDDVKGEEGYTTLERKSIRPTLDVNGIWGGYTGEGSKTVIASEASAKISMRLVPNQDWNKISDLFTEHIKSIIPSSINVEITKHHGGSPYVTPEDSRAYNCAIRAYKDTFGVEPIPQKDGGSIPIVPMFDEVLGLKSILMGFGLDSDSIHSPNEHFGIKNFYLGIDAIQNFYKHFGR